MEDTGKLGPNGKEDQGHYNLVLDRVLIAEHNSGGEHLPTDPASVISGTFDELTIVPREAIPDGAPTRGSTFRPSSGHPVRGGVFHFIIRTASGSTYYRAQIVLTVSQLN